MTKAKTTGDNIDDLLKWMAQNKSPNGPITTDMRDVPLAAIHKMAGLQFRDGLSELTLTWMRGMLGVGEEPEEDEEGKVDLFSDGDLGLTPPVKLVEIALRRDEQGQVLEVRPPAEKTAEDELGYIPGAAMSCPRCGGTGAVPIPTAHPQRPVWHLCGWCRRDLQDERSEWLTAPFWAWWDPEPRAPLPVERETMTDREIGWVLGVTKQAVQKRWPDGSSRSRPRSQVHLHLLRTHVPMAPHAARARAPPARRQPPPCTSRSSDVP